MILILTCIVYTYSLLHGFKGISLLAKACIYLFFGLLAFVLLFGGEARYIIETGLSSLGRMAQNFFELATYTDPQRTTSFPAELDDLLLGLLDGMVRGGALLHRQHFQGQDGPADDPGRVRVRRGIPRSSALSFSAIIRWGCKSPEKQILSRCMKKRAICTM